MKINFIYLLISLAIVACKSEEGSVEIYTQKYEEYEITISTINTKINDAGIAQCSKYAKTIVRDSVYTNYGSSLESVLAVAYKTTPKYIGELPVDSIQDKYLDILIENNTANRLNYDSILAVGISNAFHIKVSPVDSVLMGYELTVSDEEKLKKTQVTCGEGVIQYQEGTWSATSTKLLGYTKVIDQYSKSYISYDVPNEHCYSFEFVTGNDFNKINSKLELIGLRFKRAEIEQTFFSIEIIPKSHE